MTESNQSKDNLPRQNEQFWIEQIKLKRESGLSRAAYCKKHDLSYHTFAYWEQKKAMRKTSQLLPVKLIQPHDANTEAKSKILCSVLLKSGHKLKVHDQSMLPMLISMLK